MIDHSSCEKEGTVTDRPLSPTVKFFRCWNNFFQLVTWEEFKNLLCNDEIGVTLKNSVNASLLPRIPFRVRLNTLSIPCPWGQSIWKVLVTLTKLEDVLALCRVGTPLNFNCYVIIIMRCLKPRSQVCRDEKVVGLVNHIDHVLERQLNIDRGSKEKYILKNL